MRLELIIILACLVALGLLWYTRSQKNNPVPVTPSKNGGTVTNTGSWLEKLGKIKGNQWWFPSIMTLVIYVVVLFFSYILLPEKIWDFWSGTALCWWLLAIIPIFVLGIGKGGMVGKIGAVLLLIISAISLINDQNFNSTFGETEAERQARVAIEEMARQEEFLARQPKVVTLELPLGKWMSYRKERGSSIDLTFSGDGCVAASVDGSDIRLVCMYPEQEPKSWPFNQKMPKPVMFFEKWGDSYRFMALDEDGKATIKVSLQ